MTGTGVLSGDSTQVTCTFDKGVPVSATDVSPKLIFANTSAKTEDTALNSSSITISNPLGTTFGQTGLSCSFAGGCLYNIQANGLASALAGDANNSVTVCNRVCEIDIDASDASNAKCKLPSLMTTYSAKTFDMGTAANLVGTWTGTGSSSELLKLNDGNNLNDYSDNAVPCYFEMSADDKYVYQVSSAKVFINNLLDVSPYDGYLRLQGSQDGSTWTDLHTYDTEIHEGWNTIFAEEGSPFSYKTFRFRGAVAGSCRVGEVQLIGLQVLASTQSSTQCTA